ncbi:protein of unknown function [Methylocaldum szegediense]|uniref:Uncharacterized protein n=1 Tax=Methylocaldum szegediense TaxID=73780 RepID=A0ABM9I1J4_9GAMM|nr:protein of unknown function [Methylocaldum szegediense]
MTGRCLRSIDTTGTLFSEDVVVSYQTVQVVDLIERYHFDSGCVSYAAYFGNAVGQMD